MWSVQSWDGKMGLLGPMDLGVHGDWTPVPMRQDSVGQRRACCKRLSNGEDTERAFGSGFFVALSDNIGHTNHSFGR